MALGSQAPLCIVDRDNDSESPIYYIRDLCFTKCVVVLCLIVCEDQFFSKC